MGKYSDTISGFLLFLFAAWVCYLSKELSLWSTDGPGDGLFPFLAGMTLGLFGLALSVKSLLKPIRAKEIWADTLVWKLSAYAGSLIAYGLLLTWLGSLLSTFILFLFICRVAEKFTWKTSFVFSVLSTGSFFLTFNMLLKVQLPMGILKPLLISWGF
jgi:putative tricarboxylic transport membrane protein